MMGLKFDYFNVKSHLLSSMLTSFICFKTFLFSIINIVYATLIDWITFLIRTMLTILLKKIKISSIFDNRDVSASRQYKGGSQLLIAIYLNKLYDEY